VGFALNLSEYEAQLKTVSTRLGEIEYLELGQGPAAVFVHGAFVSPYFWRDVVEQLSSDRRCIAYSLPGHGRTNVNPDHDLGLPGQGEVIAALCDALELDQIDLVGNDTGGAFAQVFAAGHPERLRTFVLTNCECKDVLPANDPLPQLAGELAAKGELAPLIVANATNPDGARGEVGLGRLHQWPDKLSDETIEGYAKPHQQTVEAAHGIERLLLALDAKDLIALQPALRELRVPTLVIWGNDDPFFPLELGHWLRDTIPGCEELIQIEGGKLFWPSERPDEFVEPVRQFWAAHPAPEARAAAR
jgi:pimeloyl-ACP methyl ester carboxylesterase